MRIFFTLSFLVLFSNINAQTVLFNNGTVARMNPGCIVYVQNGDVKNNTGSIKNEGIFTIENNFINNDTATGGGGAGLYKVRGDFENNDLFIADQSEVQLYGANQLITGSSVTTFYNLRLAGTGIKSQTIDARIAGTLTLANLELATGGNTMFVDNTNTNAIVESGGFVSSTGNGRLARATANNTQYFYPVGSSLGVPRIRPVIIRPTTTSANNYAVRFANTDPTNEGFSRLVKAPTVCAINEHFYHLINHASGNSPADITLFYEDASDGAWQGIGHWQTVPQWENTSNPSTGTSGNYETLTINAWSNFTYAPFALINFGQTPAISVQGNTMTANPPGTSYQWYFNGNPITGATQQTYTTTQSGIYHVVVTYGDGCQGQSMFIEFSPSSTNTIEGLNNFVIFPNPGNGEVFVQAEFASPTDVFIQFTNILGQEIIPATSMRNTISLREKIDVSQFANGMYFIRLLSKKGRSTLPFIKN